MLPSPLISVAAVDMGATSGRVFQVQWDGSTLSLEESFRFRHGFARIGKHYYWEVGGLYAKIVEGLKAARAACPSLSSCGVDFWGVDHALLLKDKRLAHPVYSYRDERTNGILPHPDSDQAHLLYERTGIPPVIYNSSMQLAETLKAMPALHDSVAHCLFLPDYVNFLLSGEIANEVSITSTSQLLSLSTGGFDEAILSQYGIPMRWFTGPSKAGKKLNVIQNEDGLEGLMVSLVPGHDTACAFEGAPGATTEDFIVSSGTWVLAGAFSDKPFPIEAGLAQSISHERCGDGQLRPVRILLGLWLVEKLLESFGIRPANSAEWDELHQAVAKVSVPAAVLDTTDMRLFNPKDMRQAIDAQLSERSLPIPTTLAAYLRLAAESIAEGISGALRSFESSLGKQYRRVVLIGGGANNKVLCQAIAERCGKPVYAYQTEAAVIGNAAYQLKALDAIESVAAFRESLAEQFSPAIFT